VTDLAAIIGVADSLGLAYRGGFHPAAEDQVPVFSDGAPPATLLLFGFAGRRHWARFEASSERADGAPHPLDRWSRRSIDAMADRFGARSLYPADGPPWWPFQRWAQRAEPVHPSPLGILIHPDYGLWHAYRGALAFSIELALPAPDFRRSPCDACVAKPCLSTCPIEAVTAERYDHARCRAHVSSIASAACLDLGCLARRACPVGIAHRYYDAESRFHMAAFVGR
jgi:hypothetical protein